MEYSVDTLTVKLLRHFPGLLTLLALGVLVLSCAPHKSSTISSTSSGKTTTAPLSPNADPTPKTSIQNQKDNPSAGNARNVILNEELRNLERAAKSHSKDARSQARYGSALVESGKRREGIVFLRRAVVLDPNLTAAWHNLALAAEQQSWLDIAADAYKHVLIAKPDLVGEWIKLGYVLLPMGRFDEAERAFKRAAVFQPRSSEVLVALASSEFAYFNYDTAITILKRAISLNPRSAAIHANLASIELDRGKRAEAESAIRAAYALAPDVPRYALFLARILADSPHPENRAEMKTVLERASSLGSNGGATPFTSAERALAEYLQGLIANQDGKKAEAIAHWRKSYALDPGQPTTQLALAHALRNSGGSQETEGNRLLEVYQKSQSMRDRARSLGQEAETHPNNGRARYAYGKLLLEQNNLVHAEWELHEAVRLLPHDMKAKRLLATALRKMGRTYEADSSMK